MEFRATMRQKLIIFTIVLLKAASFLWLEDKNVDTVFYNSMPKLYKMDSFEDCGKTVDPFEFPKQYCVLTVKLVKRDNEKVLNDIKNFSQAKKFHFNHAVLKHGVCLSSCLHMHAALKDKFNEYLNDRVVMSEAPIAQGRRIMLNKLANVCINKELIDYYGLMAETTIDYCVYEELTHENYNKLFFAAVLVAAFMFTVGAVYENYEKRPRVANKLESWKRVRRCLSAFSMRRNWQALISDNALNLEDDNELLLARLYGVKILLVFLFVLSQVCRQIAAMPFANPIAVEKHINRFAYNVFNEESVVHFFFTVSGVYSAFLIIARMKAVEARFYKYFLDIFNIKHDQTFALSAFFALLLSTVLPSLSDAPFWKHVTLSEMDNCRANWRYNIMLTQNYMEPGKMCIEPTWVLAAELHLMVFAVALLLLAVRFPRYAKYVWATSLLASFTFAGFRIYSRNLPPFATLTPEMLRINHLTSNEIFHEIFYSSHMNVGNYLVGLIFGYMLHIKAPLLQKLKSNTVTSVSLLLYFLLPPTLKFILQLNYIKSTIATALVGTYLRHHDGLQLTVILFNLVFGKDERKFYAMPIFKFCEKLFLPALFAQIVVTKVFLGNIKSLVELNVINVLSYSCAIFIVSYIVAIFIHIAVQAPAINLRVSREKAETSTDKKKE